MTVHYYALGEKNDKKTSCFKVTQYLRGCPSEKNSYARCFKVNYHKLYIIRKVKNCRIRKKFPLFGRAILEKKEADKPKTTECHSGVSFRRINRVSSTTTTAKALHNVNQEVSISQRVSGFFVILISYLFYKPVKF